MSGKFAKNKSAKGKYRRLRRTLAVLSILLALLLLLAFWLEFASGYGAQPEHTEPMEQTMGDDQQAKAGGPQQTEPMAQVTEGEQQEFTEAVQQITEPPQTEETVTTGLPDGVVITELLPYTGAFMEDGTDEIVMGVLAIRVSNTGTECVQTMNITMTAGEIQAQFSLSTLFPGETVIVLEKNRMEYSAAPEFDRVQASAVVLFDERPGMCEDLLEIQCLNGVINITNISGSDITDDIMVYYKNYVGGVFYGGITYRLRIEGGLMADEIKQCMATHFNPENSKVVFATCG